MAVPVDTGGEALTGRPQTLHPKVRLRWWLPSVVVWCVFGSIGLVASAANASGVGMVVSLVVTGTLVGLSVWLAHLQWSRWSWTAFPDALELRHGVISRSASFIPFHRIQQIDVHRGPLERMLGLSSLILRTAAATTDATLPGIAAEQAESLRVQLLERSGVDDAV